LLASAAFLDVDVHFQICAVDWVCVVMLQCGTQVSRMTDHKTQNRTMIFTYARPKTPHKKKIGKSKSKAINLHRDNRFFFLFFISLD
ncbi:hypothetical protein ACJX0J_034237, partial [Zea mays]